MQSHRIKQELDVLDSLLRNETFALSMAASLHASYYEGIGQEPPPFLSPTDETTAVKTSPKDECVAINLAGFYALECCVDALSAGTNEPPFIWIERFANGRGVSSNAFLLHRFANATWKAAQPFRSLERITQKNFTGTDLLHENRAKKNAVQLRAAAAKLLDTLQPVKSATLPEQMVALRNLLHDTVYAEEMARHLHAVYALSQGQQPNLFSEASDDKPIIKTERQLKIAANLAGFNAMECAVNYLATEKNILPSTLLQKLLSKTLPKEDETLFARFANATWKAGQPFRGLARITRPVFVPFYFLPESDVEKDRVQARAAAKIVLPLLVQRSSR